MRKKSKTKTLQTPKQSSGRGSKPSPRKPFREKEKIGAEIKSFSVSPGKKTSSRGKSASSPSGRSSRSSQSASHEKFSPQKFVGKKTKVRNPVEKPSDPKQQRLQKVLAASGFGSRRECEELILAGRVEIDRVIASELGTKIDPTRCEIRVDGRTLKRHKSVYIAVYKPKGYLCTNKDEKGRRRAVDLAPESYGRLFPVGRLDMNSEGLVLLTNDGELTNRLTHPKYGVPKVYRVQVAGHIPPDTLARLKEGMYLAEGHARVEGAVVKGFHKNSTILEMTLSEGKNREIRRLLARVHHKVLTLIRCSIGPVKLGKMLPGEYRVLTSREVAALFEATGKTARKR